MENGTCLNNPPQLMVCGHEVCTSVGLTAWQAMVVVALLVDRRGVREYASQFGVTPSAVSQTYARARRVHASLPSLRRGRNPRMIPFSQLVRNSSPDSAAFDVDRI